MKLIVMFDLPTGNAVERKSYALFRKALIAEGFSMLQFSVYAKTCLGVPECMSQIDRVKANLPDAGAVTAFTMTEKQYAARQILIAPEKTRGDEDLGEQLTLSF